jgi:hypothetical protein
LNSRCSCLAKLRYSYELHITPKLSLKQYRFWRNYLWLWLRDFSTLFHSISLLFRQAHYRTWGATSGEQYKTSIFFRFLIYCYIYSLKIARRWATRRRISSSCIVLILYKLVSTTPARSTGVKIPTRNCILPSCPGKASWKHLSLIHSSELTIKLKLGWKCCFYMFQWTLLSLGQCQWSDCILREYKNIFYCNQTPF